MLHFYGDFDDYDGSWENDPEPSDDDGDEDDYYLIGCEALTAAERNPSMVGR